MWVSVRICARVCAQFHWSGWSRHSGGVVDHSALASNSFFCLCGFSFCCCWLQCSHLPMYGSGRDALLGTEAIHLTGWETAQKSTRSFQSSPAGTMDQLLRIYSFHPFPLSPWAASTQLPHSSLAAWVVLHRAMFLWPALSVDRFCTDTGVPHYDKREEQAFACMSLMCLSILWIFNWSIVFDTTIWPWTNRIQ